MSEVDPGYSLIANWIYRNSRVALTTSLPRALVGGFTHSRRNYFCDNVVVVVDDDLPPLRRPVGERLDNAVNDKSFFVDDKVRAANARRVAAARGTRRAKQQRGLMVRSE